MRERYRRIVKRRGKLKALVAVARSILVIIWHLLADPTARFHDLSPATPTASTKTTEPASSSTNSKLSATPSPSPQPPEARQFLGRRASTRATDWSIRASVMRPLRTRLTTLSSVSSTIFVSYTC